ncbi:GspH/FimT family pseudopilin [Microbulbifer sp. ZKSA002]|uniref:GspH/FimT family pseudopilin n=1 Tax=Microbulbifer sp. ZKSA002 TaxID=3243388 RepID=UPI0040392615
MKRSAGFTLIELIIYITVIAVLTAVALPSFSDFLKRYKSKAKQRELFDVLIFMRNRALSEKRNFTLCPKGISDECAGDWADGALLFADENGNGEVDSEDQVVRYMDRTEQGASLSWNAFNNRGFLIYKPTGTTPSQSGNFSFCPANGEAEYGWIIILNAIGRPYYARDKDQNGIVENGSGQELTCP